MQKLSCLIADDEPLARQLLKEYLSTEPHIEILGECRNGQDVLDMIREKKPDFLLLDIQMPIFTGINLLEELEDPPFVIFCTAYSDFAVRAFELNVVDYLVKPFSRERFHQAIQRLGELYHWKKGNITEKEAIYIRTAYQLKKFALKDILFVQGMKEYIKIQPVGDSYFLAYMRMKEIEEQLGNSFFRIHKSYIVNLNKIDEFHNDSLRVGHHQLPVSRSNRKKLLSILEK
jgi:DNA-binding LytR/AlgR family response regulator